MSDHLPECIYAPPNVDPDKGIEWGGLPCICDRLRACEQRVRDEERAGAPVAMIELAGYSRGYAAGVQAAVEAVRLSPSADIELVERSQVIDAIESLGGKQ